MRELSIKMPIPDRLIEMFSDANKVSEDEAVMHFENLFQNLINLMMPGIMKAMDETIK